MLTSASAAPPSSWFDAFHAQPCFIEHSVLSSEGQVPAHIYFQIPEGMSRIIQQLLLEIKMAAMVSCAEAHGLQGSTSPKAPLPISLRASKSSEDIPLSLQSHKVSLLLLQGFSLLPLLLFRQLGGLQSCL